MTGAERSSGRLVRGAPGARRIVILDSATFTGHHIQASQTPPENEVIVMASYTGVYCAKLVEPARPFAVIGSDCGIGKDGAGIAGLWYLEALGIPAAATDVETMELGNGADMWESGVISRTNWIAGELGVVQGQTVESAATLLSTAARPDRAADMTNRQLIFEGPDGHNIVVTNSIADALPEDYDTNVLCTAGHTGRSVVGYITKLRPYGFICSDGGGAKNESGLSALGPANEAGIPGAAVSAASARMGDGLSTYEDGRISAMNELARALGVGVGMTAKEAAKLLVDRRGA